MMFGKNPGTDATWKRIPEGSIGAELEFGRAIVQLSF